MPTNTHGVVADDVLQRCHFDTRNVTANTQPINTGVVEAFIEDEASVVNAILESKGFDLANLSDHAHTFGVVKRYIVEGAALSVDTLQGISPLVLEDLRQTHRDDLNLLRSSRSRTLGTGEPDSPSERVDHDPSNPRDRII